MVYPTWCGRGELKVFGQAFFKKLVGCGAKPHDLKSGAAAMREGRSIVISDRRAGNNAPALFFVAGFRAGDAHPPPPSRAHTRR